MQDSNHKNKKTLLAEIIDSEKSSEPKKFKHRKYDKEKLKAARNARLSQFQTAFKKITQEKWNTISIEDFTKVVIQSMIDQAEQLKLHEIIADYLSTFPYIQLHQKHFAQEDREIIFKGYYKSLEWSDNDINAKWNAFLQQFKKDSCNFFIKSLKNRYPLDIDLVLPIEMVNDVHFLAVAETALEDQGISKEIVFAPDSQGKLNQLDELSIENVDLDSLFRITANIPIVQKKVQDYLFQIDTFFAFISKNLYVRGKYNVESGESRRNSVHEVRDLKIIVEMYIKIRTTTFNSKIIIKSVYSQINKMFSLLEKLYGSDNTEIVNDEIEFVIDNMFNNEYYLKIITVQGASLIFKDALRIYWHIIGQFSSQYLMLYESQKTLVKEIFGQFDKRVDLSFDYVRKISEDQQNNLESYVKRIELLEEMGKFGLLSGIAQTPKSQLDSENSWFFKRTSDLINFMVYWDSITTNKSFEFPYVYNVEGRAYRLRDMFNGHTVPIQADFENFERIILYFKDLFFQGDTLRYNHFLLAQYKKYYAGNPMFSDSSVALYVPLPNWVKNSIMGTGYFLDRKSFWAEVNEKLTFILVQSYFERRCIEKALSLKNVSHYIFPSDFAAMSNNDLKMVVRYTDFLGKFNKNSVLDLGLRFSADKERGILIEYLGYGQINPWGKIYGSNKDLACVEYLKMNYVPIYVSIDETETELYYQTNMNYIGIQVPLLTTLQYNFLIEFMIDHDTGFEQALCEIVVHCDPTMQNVACKIQEAFGLNSASLDTLNAIGEIPTEEISSKYQKWWTNWHRSNEHFINGLPNRMHEQLHFDPLRKDYDFHT